jgi:proline iminopeptidase
VLAVVLFAFTTSSRREVDWITEGVGMVFPEA